MKISESPKLAAPGAGLPFLERAIARLMLGFRCLTGNRGSFDAHFKNERESIRRLIAPLSAGELGKRVLISRPRGLEDSSRDWSVLMTLDHLRIVNSTFIGIIGSLAVGTVPDGEASTADVKPDPSVAAGVMAEYEAACDALLGAVAAVPDLKTAARYRHPWFWKMNAHEWHALSGGHMGIHRVQIERIIAGLR